MTDSSAVHNGARHAPKQETSRQAEPAGAVPEDILQAFAEKVNPYLISHGGTARPLSYEKGVLTIRMEGACRGCMMADATLNGHIRRVLQEEKLAHPVKEIEISDEVSPELWEMAQKILRGELK